MVQYSPLSRWNRLRSILRVVHGPSAAILPPTVTRMHMEFAKKIDNGHKGAKAFWRENLRSLKYHNPRIPMIVNRTTDQDGPATMSIYFQKDPTTSPDPAAAATPPQNIVHVQPPSSGNDTSKAVDPAADERVVKIDMKHKHSDEILDLFLAETSARKIEPTPEVLEELAELEAFERQAELDRVKTKAYVDAVKKEEEMLAKAKEVVGA